MDAGSFVSAVLVLLLVLDPVGNVPVFVSLLKNVEPERRTWVLLREWAIAFALLLVFVFFGRPILRLLGLSEPSLTIAGGVILFLIAVRMIFRTPEGVFGDALAGEPFIVPLAIPSIAGPSALATVMLLVSRAPQRLLEWTAAVAVAMLATLALLAFAERVARLVGERALLGFERLTGLVLAAIAVEMLLKGIESFVRQL